MPASDALSAGGAAEQTGDFASAAHHYALVLEDGDAHQAAEARFRIARIAYRLDRPEQLDFARAWLRSSLKPSALALYTLCRLRVPYRLVKRLVPRRRYSPPSS